MSCFLILRGKNLDIDDFIIKSGIKDATKKYKGEPKLKSKPNGEKIKYSQLSVMTSNAGFDNIEKQISETIKYLKRNYSKFEIISKTKSIEYAFLDIGIKSSISRSTPLQLYYYPVDLIRLAGELGLGIHNSIYSYLTKGQNGV